MTVTVGTNNVKIIILTKPISYVKQKKQSMDSLVILKYITLRVPCTSQAGCLSPCSVRLGSFECANSLIDIVAQCADDGQRLQLW